jgi:two-component system response regulator PilR (NtrC family)
MATPAPVLIVDGDSSMTAMLQRFLTRQRVNAQGVLSPGEAQAVLAQQTFQVVLTDYFAPSGDGLALLRSIRQTVPGTRGILMAAFGAPDLYRAALAEGAYACLAKPFRLQDLWDIVQPALQGFPAPAVSRRSDQGGLGQPPRTLIKSLEPCSVHRRASWEAPGCLPHRRRNAPEMFHALRRHPPVFADFLRASV